MGKRLRDREVIELLARSEFFKGLEPEGLERVRRAASSHRLSAGEHCFHQEDPAERLYLLVSGRIKLTQVTIDGRQVLLRIVEPGEMFGGIALFVKERYPAGAEAMEESELLSWDGSAMLELIQVEPKVALNVIQHLAQLVQSLQDRVRELSTERVEKRIARTLVRLAAQSSRGAEAAGPVVLHLSRQDLGELAGATLYTVSRILSRWESEGLIESGRERIVVVKPQELEALADDPGGGLSSERE